MSQRRLMEVKGFAAHAGRMTEDSPFESTPELTPPSAPVAPPEPPPWPPLAPPEPPMMGRPRAAKRLGVFGLLFVAGAAAGSGVASGVILARQSPSSAPVSAPTTSAPNGTSTPGGGGGATAAPTPASGSTTPSSIAAGVDPAVVDINGTLAAGGEVAGTGIVISSSGEVLTNNHVIAGTSHISIQIDGTGPTYTATVLGTDVTDDIALLRIQGVSGLKTVSIGDSSTVTVGQTVVAIGNALGRGGTPAATQGSVTALNQTITAGDSAANTETLNGTIQIDAFIQPGDSGGPLVDTSGRVVGIDTAAQSAGRFADSGSNIGFAIPINQAMTVARQIAAGQGSSTVQIGTRGILGVDVQDGAGVTGALVAGVVSGSPAAQAGIVSGDVITAVNGTTVTSASALTSVMTGRHAGDRVAVSWLDASGQTHTATIQLEAGPPA